MSNLFFEHVTGTRMPHWQDAVRRYLATRSASGTTGTAAEARCR
jgi:hypothetical protein